MQAATYEKITARKSSVLAEYSLSTNLTITDLYANDRIATPHKQQQNSFASFFEIICSVHRAALRKRAAGVSQGDEGVGEFPVIHTVLTADIH